MGATLLGCLITASAAAAEPEPGSDATVDLPFAPVMGIPAPRALRIALDLGRRPGRLDGVTVTTVQVRVSGPLKLVGAPDLDQQARTLVYRVLPEKTSGRAELSMQVDLRRGRRILRRLRIRQRFELRPDWPQAAEVDGWGRALEQVRSRRVELRTELEQPAGYQDPSGESPEARAVRLRRALDAEATEQEVLHQALTLTARQSEDLALARAATLAAVRAEVATASLEASPPPSSDAVEALRAARIAMLRLQAVHARVLLGQASSDPNLSPALLARTLELRSGLARMHGRDAAARQLAIQALTLLPTLSANHPLPWVSERFRQETEVLAPGRALSVGKIDLLPTDGPQGPVLGVSAAFGPDPGRLVRSGALTLAETGQRADLKASHEGADGSLNGQIPFDPRDARQVALRLELFDEAGHTVAVLGDPSPIYVPLAEPPRKKLRIPGWVWWVAGGAAVTGAAVATGVAISDGSVPQPNRALGPIEVRF